MTKCLSIAQSFWLRCIIFSTITITFNNNKLQILYSILYSNSIHILLNMFVHCELIALFVVAFSTTSIVAASSTSSRHLRGPGVELEVSPVVERKLPPGSSQGCENGGSNSSNGQPCKGEITAITTTMTTVAAETTAITTATAKPPSDVCEAGIACAQDSTCVAGTTECCGQELFNTCECFEGAYLCAVVACQSPCP